LEAMYVRQREQAPVIQRIGDVFLEAATEFRLAYPIYIGHLPLAEKRLKDEIESNAEFRLFLEVRLSYVVAGLHLMSFIPTGMLSTIGSTPGFTSARPQTFSNATFEAPSKIPRPPRGYLKCDCRRQSRHRLCVARYSGHTEFTKCGAIANIPVRDGQGCPR